MSAWDDLVGDDLVMVILRGLPPTQAAETARALWAAGIELLEVTIGDPAGVEALHAVIAEARGGHQVGAGTVTTLEQVDVAAAAGAAFTVAPGLDERVCRASAAAGMPHLPGIATATEIQRALAAGCTWLKAFPASVLGPGWFQAMTRGPFPHVKLVATGGVSPGNAVEFLDAGARLLGVGHAIADQHQRERLLLRLASRRTSGGQAGAGAGARTSELSGPGGT